MRYLVIAVLLLFFGVGAVAAGLVRLPWAPKAEVADAGKATAKEQQKTKITSKAANGGTKSTAGKQPANETGNKSAQAEPDKQPQNNPTKAAPKQQQASVHKPAGDQQAKPRRTATGKLGVDVARIDPEGSSVIAGFAQPSAKVIILANGKAIGTATADENGDWVLVTSNRVSGDDPKISVQPAAEQSEAPSKQIADNNSSRGQSTPSSSSQSKQASASTSWTAADASAVTKKPTTVVAAAASPAPAKIMPVVAAAERVQTIAPSRHIQRTTADDVASDMIERIRKLTKDAQQSSGDQDRPTLTPNNSHATKNTLRPVETAETDLTYIERPQSPRAGRTTPANGPAFKLLNAQPTAANPSRIEGTRLASVAQPSSGPALPPRTAKLTEPLPVPVQFVFREPTFTQDGREAAEVLLAYLKAKNYKSVVLSGHADERGTPEANLRLSQRRLKSLRRFLREGGFKGQLKLVPKGESEKYTGVDRSQFPLEELYQLDRRVEVVAAE